MRSDLACSSERGAVMPLLDHFHPPLKGQRPWEGVHSEWAGAIARQLNRKPLPKQYFAIPHIHFGGRVEIDAATVEYDAVQASAEEAGGTATAVWAPPRPTLETEVDFVDLDVIEMRVYDEKEGLRLVAAVELVSPANKDREEHREAFVVKCAAYLQEGVSLIVVDVVTERTANLHRQLVDLLKLSGASNGREFPDLYAVAYRTFTTDRKGRLQGWEEPLAVGRILPTLPLWISPDVVVPVDLESSYRETCEGLRIRL
jgi:hypothetical protein